jgi:hypothetical protein
MTDTNNMIDPIDLNNMVTSSRVPKVTVTKLEENTSELMDDNEFSFLNMTGGAKEKESNSNNVSREVHSKSESTPDVGLKRSAFRTNDTFQITEKPSNEENNSNSEENNDSYSNAANATEIAEKLNVKSSGTSENSENNEKSEISENESISDENITSENENSENSETSDTSENSNNNDNENSNNNDNENSNNNENENTNNNNNNNESKSKKSTKKSSKKTKKKGTSTNNNEEGNNNNSNSGNNNNSNNNSGNNNENSNKNSVSVGNATNVSVTVQQPEVEYIDVNAKVKSADANLKSMRKSLTKRVEELEDMKPEELQELKQKLKTQVTKGLELNDTMLEGLVKSIDNFGIKMIALEDLIKNEKIKLSF